MNLGVWEEVGCVKFWNEWCRITDIIYLFFVEAFCVFYYLKLNFSVRGFYFVCLRSSYLGVIYIVVI